MRNLLLMPLCVVENQIQDQDRKAESLKFEREHCYLHDM